MHYAGHSRSGINPPALIPLFRPAAGILRPFDHPPISSIPDASHSLYLPPTEQDLRRRDLANAEAALAGLVNALNVARAGTGEANRISTAPIMSGDRVLNPALRYSPQRMRERKSYAFRLFNQRRSQVSAARRRVEAARALLALPTLASLEDRAAAREAVRARKRICVFPIASAPIT